MNTSAEDFLERDRTVRTLPLFFSSLFSSTQLLVPRSAGVAKSAKCHKVSQSVSFKPVQHFPHANPTLGHSSESLPIVSLPHALLFSTSAAPRCPGNAKLATGKPGDGSAKAGRSLVPTTGIEARRFSTRDEGCESWYSSRGSGVVGIRRRGTKEEVGIERRRMRVAAGRVGAESVLGTAMEGGRRVRMEEGSFGTVWAMGVTMGKGTGVRAGLGGTEEARLSSAKRLLRESKIGRAHV